MAHFIEDMIGPSGDVSPEENAQMRQATPSDWQRAAELQEAQRREDAVRREQQAMMDQRRATIGENGAMFDNIVQTDAKVKQRAGQLRRRAAVGLLSAYKLGASVDGGRVPPSVYTMVGGMLGYDNKTSGIGNIQVGMDGSMTITPFANVNGQLQMQDPIKLPFETMYGMGLENQGVLTADEMTALRSNAVLKQNLTEDMANRMYPAVPEGYGNPDYVPVGGRTENGAINVGRAFSRGPRVKGGGGSFFSDGKGGFIRTRSDESTGFQTVEERSGTLADDYKGRWKVLRGGGGQTTYKNDKTGDVVTVRDGETPPWVANASSSEKERIARINADGRIKAAEKANETKMNLADVSARLKERGLDIQQQNADERSAHNQAVEAQQAENEKGRSDRAKMANELKTKMAEMKSKGTIGGRPPTTHEYVEALRFANDLLNDEADRNAMREHAKRIEESLKQRGEKIPEPPSPSGKTEVKTGDNGGGDGKQFKEGDVQEINGIKMKLLPSKKNPGKLTWQRV